MASSFLTSILGTFPTLYLLFFLLLTVSAIYDSSITKMEKLCHPWTDYHMDYYRFCTQVFSLSNGEIFFPLSETSLSFYMGDQRKKKRAKKRIEKTMRVLDFIWSLSRHHHHSIATKNPSVYETTTSSEENSVGTQKNDSILLE